ncbi:MAG: hypothetical protein QOH43_1682 [Solirubrobacteraceae bacterium]|jgi:uncharacterized protein YndB with AHSA1/START domain|nr:hypothetical protein [Solirubrobacteraceae bacterium]
MARNTIEVATTPQQVFAVLADAAAYGEWVVGSKEVRDVDPDFPAVGTRFHHTVGPGGPLRIKDHSQVLESDPPNKLVLRARARPLGTANVVLELEGIDGGTRVTIDESAGDLLSRLTSFNPLVDPLVKLRNAESLRRLKRIAERRAAGAAA